MVEGFISNEAEDGAESSMDVFFRELKYNTIIITPEVRYYLSGKKGAPRGMYLGAFFRYSRHSGTSLYPHERDTGEIVDFDGDLKSNALGGGLGYVFPFVSIV